jgi:uncharacterized membrane protein
MQTKISTIVTFVSILISFGIGVYLYPQLPEQMASHWNAGGEVDGYMSKFWGVFLLPMILLGMFLLFLILPKIDPLKKNFVGFKKYYNALITFIIIFLFYIYALTIVWNMGVCFNMTQFVIPAVGILFFYIGTILEHTKRNWFVGIRTPWTLSSDAVWDKTQKLGGKLFKITGVVILLGVLFPQYLLWLVLIPTISTVLIVIAYSYFEYQKEKILP